MRKLSAIVIYTAAIAVGFKVSQVSSTTFAQASQDAPLIHVSSGFSFQSQVASFHRVDATQYDSAGEDISVGYNNEAVPIAATVYVYPAHARPLAQEFAARQKEVMHGHPGARLLSTGTAMLTPRQLSAPAATYSFQGIFAGKTQLLRSELLVALLGDRFVEYRFTYPDTEQVRARSEVDSFEHALPWPP